MGDDASLDTLQVELSVGLLESQGLETLVHQTHGVLQELTPSELERLSKEDTDLELQQDWMPKHPDFMVTVRVAPCVESSIKSFAAETS